MTPTLTDAGRNLMLRALNGDVIHFTKIQMGSGTRSTPVTATSLQTPKLTLDITKINVGEQYATLTTSFSNSTVTTGFRVTEAGFFAKNPNNPVQEILYAYGSEDASTADYVPPASNRILEMQFDALLFIGDAENVTAAINSSLVYASASEFNAHVANVNNPHTVTKAQVGLGSVPNVATNDQTPTFTQGTTLTNITSGEKTTSIFGKIAKAVTDLISHLANKQNPHTVTLAQVGGAAASHNHDAGNITSGTLPVNRGGIGTTSLTTGGILRGNSTGAITVLTGAGALYAASSGSPTFGTLPVAQGGTGVTSLESLASSLNNVSISTGYYLGNGTTARTISLGFTPKAILVFASDGQTQDDVDGTEGGLALNGCNLTSRNASTSYVFTWSDAYCALGVVTNGFKVNYYSSNRIYTNTNGQYYYYVAIR